MTTDLPVAGQAMRHVLRFDGFDRRLHVLLMVSFLGLAATGLPLLLSESWWAASLARLLGGVVAAGILHRIFAVVLVLVCLAHLGRVFHRALVRRESGIFWGPTSLVPQPRDAVELFQHVRWFLGLGRRPRFDHFTYWEKFDYLAVFWGMAIIGGSGLVLWFPVFSSRLLPGWMFNVALLVHGEEALLAVGFIFTIHFFNSHLRPEKFPIDLVIFTGRVPEHEFREERPAEFERLQRAQALERVIVEAPTAAERRHGRVLGGAAVLIGLILVVITTHAFVQARW